MMLYMYHMYNILDMDKLVRTIDFRILFKGRGRERFRLELETQAKLYDARTAAP